MDNNDGHSLGCRRPTLPPSSTRTLHHPSLLPFHLSTCQQTTVCPFTPAECFYIDPTMKPGRRVPSTVTGWRVFNCFQLNTPPPVMSVCLAPPNVPDPFRATPHPIRDLGSLTTKTNTLQPAVQPRRVILQLTQEEEQAVTNLLKLHHQEPVQREAGDPLCGDVPCQSETGLQGRCWSDTELEAANTLLSRFSLMEEDKLWW